MLNQNEKIWDCPKKSNARLNTIIEPYNKFFGAKMPKEKQYWTVCGQHTLEDGTFNNNSELGQILQHGLITKDQFHGVDLNKDIIEANINVSPESHWYCGDFYNEIQNETFNPHIVNLDLIGMPKTQANYINDVFQFLTSFDGEMLLIINLVVEYQRFVDRNTTINELIDILNNKMSFRKSISKWTLPDYKYFEYDGTGAKSRSKMASLVLVKKS